VDTTLVGVGTNVIENFLGQL